MTIPQGFQKAKIQIEGGEALECAFNPESYTISKTNIWNFKPNQRKDRPEAEFGGGMPMHYKLTLLLDVSLQGSDASVKDQANKLMQAMHGNHKAPSFLTFTWGSVKLPKAAPLSMSIQYTLFHSNGEPIRALVDLELAQAEDLSPAGIAQNPTTRGLAGLRTHTVRDGDSLSSIAHSAYGDPTRWRVIAEANHIDNPLRLQRGAMLTIPRLDT